MSRLAIPFINPLHFVPTDPLHASQYESRHMEDFWLEDRLNRWQYSKRWAQPFRSDDVISQQFNNNAGLIGLQIIDCNKVVQGSVNMTQVRSDPFDPDYYLYENNWPLTGLSGTYWMIVRIGGVIEAVSEPFLVQSEQVGTLLIQYGVANPDPRYSYYENVIFGTGFSPSIRIPGLLRKKPIASKDTIYEDQDLDMVMVHSKPYRLWELWLGASLDSGTPDWFEDTVGRILGCSSLRIDGRYYTKNEGTKLEEFDERYNGVLYSHKIELRERINRHSRIFDTTGINTNEELLITLNTTSRGFADTETNQDGVVQFINVE